MGGSWKQLMGLFNLFLAVSMAIDPNCDYYQQLTPGEKFYVYNPQYPGSYGANTACRWIAQSEVGTQIVVACDEINIPASSNCNQDHLAISLSGNPDFTDSHNYCGQGSVNLVTDSNSLSIGLFSTSTTNGGRFICTITAVGDNKPTTTTERPNVCDCGWKNGNRIVNGHETGVNEFPSMSALIDLEKRWNYCGSTIISDRYVVTAAHCLTNRLAANIAVLVGDHNVSSGLDTPYSALYQSLLLIVHPQFDSNTMSNDVGLIKTTSAISFSMYVGPICLPFKYSGVSFNGQMVTALGWGQLQFSEDQSDVLQEVDLNVIDTNLCRSQVNQNTNPVTDNQVCTYTPGKDTCLSDSGGPLVWQDPNINRLQLLGIISYGFGCATSQPSINTRATSYLSWIVSQTVDASYCIK